MESFNNIPKNVETKKSKKSKSDELIDSDSEKSNIIFMSHRNEENDDPFEYVKNDREEQEVMEKMAVKYDDHELNEALIFGNYFLDKKFIAKKRKQYGVVREKSKRKEVAYEDYQKKYFEVLEELYDTKMGRDSNEKDYQNEYYYLLDNRRSLINEINDLKSQIKDLSDALLKSQKNEKKLIKDNKEMKNELEKINLKIAGDIQKNDVEKKEVFKKAMIRCPICFGYHYKGNIAFLSCTHYLCRVCLNSLDGDRCPICKRSFHEVVVPNYGDDLTSEDYRLFENDQN